MQTKANPDTQTSGQTALSGPSPVSTQNTTGSGEIAELSALCNQSSVVQSRLRLAQEINQSPRVQAQLQLKHSLQESPRVRSLKTAQRAMNSGSASAASPEPAIPNRTGLPDNLKAGVERLSGISMDDVKVHYNSPKPSQLQAYAYAQGTDIHVSPGQEKHLPHEAWHIVQQKQGRVKPTMQMRQGIAINDDSGLEKDADVMGAKAVNAGKSAANAAPVVSGTQSSPGPVQHIIQGEWVVGGLEQLQKEHVLKLAEESPIKGFIAWIEFRNVGEEKEFLQSNQELLGKMAPQLSEVLGNTLSSDGFYTIRYLLQLVAENLATLQSMKLEGDSAEVDESDHPDGTDAEEELIDWADLEPQGLERLPKDVLYQIFLNLVNYHYEKAKRFPIVDLGEAYSKWIGGGPHTRSKFKTLIGLEASEQDSTEKIIQRARSGNSFTLNGPYQGSSNSFSYKNVIYYRDSGGNIDFTKDPKSVVAAFNKATGDKLKVSDIAWKNPQDTKSEIQMSHDLKDPKKGVMPSGKSVDLPKASRPQHFAIADKLYPNSRSGTWTWHHLTKKYKMVLVDMKVHSKHGHNGGVLLWNK